MALAIWPARQGQQRSLRRMFQVFSWALARPQDVALWAGDDLQAHAVMAVLAGVERPVSGHSVNGDEGAVDDYERVPSYGRRQRIAQFRRASGQQRDCFARVPPGRGGPTPNPAASSAKVSPLRRWASTSRACRPGFSLRQHEPICLRWHRMTLAT
jgi:hypothetical protein